MNRRSFLTGLIAAPAVILTPGLLMPVKAEGLLVRQVRVTRGGVVSVRYTGKSGIRWTGWSHMTREHHIPYAEQTAAAHFAEDPRVAWVQLDWPVNRSPI